MIMSYTKMNAPTSMFILDLIGRLLDANSSSMVAIRDVHEHMKRRRPWHRGFNQKALVDYQPLIATRGSELISRLSEIKGVVRLDQWIGYFTYVPAFLKSCTLRR